MGIAERLARIEENTKAIREDTKGIKDKNEKQDKRIESLEKDNARINTHLSWTKYLGSGAIAAILSYLKFK